MTPSPKLTAIKRYDSLGWKVIPLDGKRPYWPRWDDVDAWKHGLLKNNMTYLELKKDPSKNIGILTGEVSGIIAIDVDQPKVAGYDPRPAIEKGALAHSTSKAPRLIFRSNNPEILKFSRKVTKKREEVDESLIIGDEGKKSITIVEILGTGRQFVTPPSIHPKTGQPYKWLTPLPDKPEDILEIKDLNHLKQILSEIFKNKQIVFELFGKEEMAKKAREQQSKTPDSLLQKWFDTITQYLKKYEAKDQGDYIQYHCPLHPPDNNPSFVIYKNTKLAVDFHDGTIYTLKELAQRLGINLPIPKKRKIRSTSIAWIPLHFQEEEEKEEGTEEEKEEGKGEGENKESEKSKPKYGWLKIEKVANNKYLVSIIKDGKTVIPARQVPSDFAFRPAFIKYFFNHIKKEVGEEKFNAWLGELQQRIRQKITYLELNLLPEDEDKIPLDQFDIEELRKFGIDDVEAAFKHLILDSFQDRSLHARIAEFLMERFTFKTIEDSEEVLYYKNGVYKFNGEQKIKELVQRLLTAFAVPHLAKKSLVDEVIEYIKRSTYVSIREFYKFDESGLINLKNGVLDPETLELSPHSPEYLFLWQLPVEYNPSADCPKIKKFLSEIVTPEDVETLLRVAAYPLMPGQPFQVAMFLVGSGSNGKSTFLNLLKALYGHENVSALPLHDLENNRFAPASLLGKLANICADIPSKPLDKIETFKAITGGDSIQVEKKFKQSYPVPYLRAKLIFSANKLPELSEYTYAALRRFVIIRFPYKFEGKKKNPNLLNELTTEEELSGFLNLVLQAYQRLKKGGFATKSVEETQMDWIRWSSPLRAFIMQHIEAGDGQVPKDEIWEAFYIYCKHHNIQFPFIGEGAKKSFFKQLRKALRDLDIEVGEARPTIDGKRARVFTGIKLVRLEQLRGEEGEGEEEYNPLIEKEVVNVLSMQPATFDELIEMTGIPEDKLRKAILRLEKGGIIFAQGGKYLLNAKKAKEAGFDIVEVIHK